jgi:hypothetical protein
MSMMSYASFPAIGAMLLLGIGCSTTDTGGELLGTKSQAVYNGETPKKTVEQLGFAYVEAPSKQEAGRWEAGSGVFFDNFNLLTAAHVVEGALTPGAVNVRLGNQVFHGTAKFRPQNPSDAHPLDIAVVTLDKPAIINGNAQTYMRPLLNLNGDGVYNLGTNTVDCYGYGPVAKVGGADQGSGELRFGSMALTPRVNNTAYKNAYSSDYFWVTATDGTQPQLAFGDSGGPCLLSSPTDPLSGAVVGINKGISSVPVGYPPRYGFITALGWWGQFWVQMAARGIALANADIDGDGTLDTVAITTKDGGPLGKLLNLEVLFSNDQFPGSNHGLLDFGATGLFGASEPVPPSAAPQPLIAAGDFNGDHVADTVAILGSNVLYYDGVKYLAPVLHSAPFQLIADDYTDYVELRSGDFNNDTIDDLEALMSNGYVDIYYGSSDGLRPGVKMNGNPTADGRDGKFLSLTGPGLITRSSEEVGNDISRPWKLNWLS